MVQQPFFALLVSLALAAVAYRRGSLSRTGVMGALIVGVCTLGFGGWVWGALVGIFFVTSSWLSHFRENEKRRVAREKFDKTHERDLGQALANGGVGSLAALLNAFFPAAVWFPFFVGAIATVTADTWATELGTLSKRPPRLITTGRVVEVGTSGGISPFGTSISLLGGIVIGLTAGLLSEALSFSAALLIGGLSGLVGSLFDSLLGATVQAIYYSDLRRQETERKIDVDGTPTRYLRGWRWMNNDLVNAVASVIGAGTAAGIWFALGL